ncbi:MAG: hypothetical protein NTX03_06015, partial [Bacteroidetes bacterium]|nr:hypothetical protein [Bacteroidota bacterium]
MKSHYIYIVLAAACLSCGQNKPKSGNAKCENSNLNDSILLQKYEAFLDKVEYINSDYDMKVLERIEKSRDTILLENFIKENYDIIKPYKEFSLIPKELVKYTYAIDFNGDSLLDIFYDGPTGAMPRISQIFLNLGTRYKKVFSEYQDIIKMDFINNKLHSFILNNEGCCADPQIVDYT